VILFIVPLVIACVQKESPDQKCKVVPSGVRTILITPDNAIALRAAKSLEAFDIASNRKLWTAAPANYISLDSAGKNLVADYSEGSFRVLDVQTGTVKFTAHPGRGAIKDLHFRSDQSIMVVFPGNEIVEWRINQGSERTLFKKSRLARYLGGSQNGEFVAFAENPGVAIRDLTNETTRRVDSLAGLDPIALSNDGTRLATDSDENEVKVWDVVTGKELQRIKCDERPVCLTLSAKGDLVAIAYNQLVLVWDLNRKKEILKLQCMTRVTCLTVSADNSIIAVGQIDGSHEIHRIDDK
jgi:WD40 repeat protein